MREPTYFILAALLRGPRHGYAIIKLVEELSGGSVRLATGTLYATVDRLHDAGLVEAVKQEVVNGRSRRYYALTATGQEAVHEEAARMVRAARAVEHAPASGAARIAGGRRGVAPA
jgi:DNA-binding PadR family transcriptional regulator